MIFLILSIYLEHNKGTWYNLGHVNKHKLFDKITCKIANVNKQDISLLNP